MFSTSTQRQHWSFSSEEEIAILKEDTNSRFIEQHGKNLPEDAQKKFYLTAHDERVLVKQYEYYLREFCRKFQPQMPKSVIGTSFHYFKRFYLYKSVMDYHPKEILVTCVYLAAKVEEFNVSIMQFVANVKGDREKAMDIILNNELLLMQQVNYNLTVHNPFRPLEGLLIDIKTRCPDFQDPERLRPYIDDFLDKIFLTDALFMFSPSQIALAAVFHGVSKVKENLDSYLTETVVGKDKERIAMLTQSIRQIRTMYKNLEQINKDEVALIEKKLVKCRNQENNPDSQAYKRKMQEMLQDEEDRSSRKIAKITERQKREEEELLTGTHLD